MGWEMLAPGKVNLALFLGPTRSSDNRHELVTVFQSLSLADRLTAVPAETDTVVCAGVDGENLAARAIRLLREHGWDGPPLRIEIEKRIPVAAGMAGGSADAAAALRIAAAAHPLEPGLAQAVAILLGADVPSQLRPGVSLGTGAGEHATPLAALHAHAYVVIPSPERLPTPAVFHEADRLGLPRSAGDLESLHEQLKIALKPGVRLPEELLVNDLAPAAISLCPSISAALEDARAVGADTALVSGSGPTVVGLKWGTEGREWAEKAAFELCSRHPGAVAATPVTPEFAA